MLDRTLATPIIYYCNLP